jgi:hypothetical protein
MGIFYKVTKGAAYFAGLDLPFFVGAQDIAEAAREQGFQQVQVTPRENARFAFEVRKVPGYSDDWNAAFFGIYEGKASLIEVPQVPTWLFEVRPQIPPPGQTVVAQIVPSVRSGRPVVKNGSRVVLWIAGGAVLVAAAWALTPAERA